MARRIPRTLPRPRRRQAPTAKRNIILSQNLNTSSFHSPIDITNPSPLCRLVVRDHENGLNASLPLKGVKRASDGLLVPRYIAGHDVVVGDARCPRPNVEGLRAMVAVPGACPASLELTHPPREERRLADQDAEGKIFIREAASDSSHIFRDRARAPRDREQEFSWGTGRVMGTLSRVGR